MEIARIICVSYLLAATSVLPQSIDNHQQLKPSTLKRGAHMGIIGTIIVGLIVGALGRFVLPGAQPMGWIMTCVLGIAGSVGAGFLGQALGWYMPGEGAGWIASILGAAILLFIVQKVRGKA
jgi:uncharacterized membrane protein YeaQ/YmgE (transglycosylase-associated protein family)